MKTNIEKEKEVSTATCLVYEQSYLDVIAPVYVEPQPYKKGKKIATDLHSVFELAWLKSLSYRQKNTVLFLIWIGVE